MNLILILGPPAVGKMTVGKELAKLTGYKLFHNHMSIELVRHFFEFGTPSFRNLDKVIRYGIFEEVAKSDLPGLIFTLVTAFNEASDITYLEKIAKFFADDISEVTIVELSATLEERLIRNRGEDRLMEKASKRDVEWSEEVLLKHDKQYRMNTIPDEFPHWNLLKIDNTILSPQEVAAQVVEHYRL